MSKLDEIIRRKPSRWGNLSIKEFECDIKFLQTRAEQNKHSLEQIDVTQEINERLRERVEELEDFYNEMLEEAAALSDQNQRYKQGLEFYANGANYLEIPTVYGSHSPVSADGGQEARQALKEGEAE